MKNEVCEVLRSYTAQKRNNILSLVRCCKIEENCIENHFHVDFFPWCFSSILEGKEGFKSIIKTVF